MNKVAQQWSNKMEAGIKTSDSVAPVGGRPVTQAPTYSRRFNDGVTAADEARQLKQKLITDASTGATPFGVATFDEKDARALLAKEAQVKEADFDGWFGANFQVSDLPTRQLAAKLNPDYYNSREKQMVERAKMALRIHLIQFRGPRDEEDLRILYGLATGDIVLGANWDKIGADDMSVSDGRTMLREQLTLPARIFQRGRAAPTGASFWQQNATTGAPATTGGFADDILSTSRVF